MNDAIKQTEEAIAALVQQLERLRKDAPPVPVKNYPLRDL